MHNCNPDGIPALRQAQALQDTFVRRRQALYQWHGMPCGPGLHPKGEHVSQLAVFELNPMTFRATLILLIVKATTVVMSSLLVAK